MESPEPQTVRALVTGAGRGIGAAIARALASAGHPVVVNYRENEAAASQVCAEINENGGEATSVRFNVAEAAEVDDALATLREDPRPIGIVINNAGVIKDGLFPTTRPDAWWIGVGVSLSFLCGDVKRAPRWMQRAGIEWLHRMFQEPGKLVRRYLMLGLPFAARLLAGALRTRLRRRLRA